MKPSFVFLFGALFVASAAAGSIPWERCGGVGTLRDVRMEGCNLEETCVLNPGTPYIGEVEFVPSSASPSLRLRVSIFHFSTIEIINVEVPGSSVQPGIDYLLAFSITPNDLLSGNTLPISAAITASNGARLEVCVGSQIHIA